MDGLLDFFYRLVSHQLITLEKYGWRGHQPVDEIVEMTWFVRR